MKITIIITAILFVYAAFSTIFVDTKLVGNIGKIVGETNLEFFGYFAYINLLILFYPLYRLYVAGEYYKKIDYIVGWILFFIACVILSGLILPAEGIGYVAREIIFFLYPFIGKAGLWLLWFMIFALSLVLIADDDFSWRSFAKEKATTSLSFSIDKLGAPFLVIGKLFKSIFKNPFASAPLDNEFFIDEEREVKKIPSQTKSTSRRSVIEPLEEIRSEIKNSDLSDIVLDKKRLSAKKSHVEIIDELEENSKLLASIDKGAVTAPKNFRLPKIDFLQKAPRMIKKVNEDEIDRKIGDLLDKLKRFNIEGDVVRTYSGPLVTTFEFKPAPHVKISKILGLQDDLAMALSAETIRIQAPIPGRDVVGIEIPNDNIDTIYLREVLESDIFQNAKSSLTVALGKDIVGRPFLTDIKKLPHLLIAGTTGSGKSVGINAMILSLLYRNDPDHLKLMMIDPKMLEFSVYNDIPHLITPVITSPKKAITALANMVTEMERRYQLMAENRTKNIETYNEKAKRTGEAELPYIVVIIDELADLMMTSGKEVEYSIARLAQMARASGIHLIVATQRPSVDVVTGLIKANLPSRLSYRVGQRIDSKVILDTMGAESLLGRGDALFTPPGAVGLVRLHAPWSSEEEIEKIVEYLKLQREPEYDESYLNSSGGNQNGGLGQNSEGELDPLYNEAREIILTDKKTSISYLQRKLQIGYNRSANIIEQLQANGVLSAPNVKGNREIL
ncbi:MAG: DNA translocase FtsK [Campylobacterales bacterium]|nr:DNA translocase FtsK [Campylobacterales bacterium]